MKDSIHNKIFRTVDHDYVVAAAKAAHGAGVPHFSVISSWMANPTSRFAFFRIKGDMEVAVQKIGFPGVSIFRTVQLTRNAAQRKLLSERLVLPLLASLDKIFPPKIRKFRMSIHVADVAKAMITEFESCWMKQEEKVTVYSSRMMQDFVMH